MKIQPALGILLAAILSCTAVSWGHLRLGKSAEEMVAEADIIFTGKALHTTGPVADEAPGQPQGWPLRETRFQVISVTKGKPTTDTLTYQHPYCPPPETHVGDAMFCPGYYDFVAGRTYRIMAKKTGEAGVLRQFWDDDQGEGVVPDRDIVPVTDGQPPDEPATRGAILAELMGMLSSGDTQDLCYAIGEIGWRKGWASDAVRTEVLAAMRPLMTHSDPRVAQRAIRVVGSGNPYFLKESGYQWVALPGVGKVLAAKGEYRVKKNPGGELCWKDLVALASGPAPAETRALAVRALGLVAKPELRPSIERWTSDPAPAVRAAAALLLADFPGPEMRSRLTTLARDPAPEVRAGVALAAGFVDQAEMAGTLARLLADADPEVRDAAAMSLLSISPRDEATAAIFRNNVEKGEYAPLFLIALAREHPQGYLDSLAKIAKQETPPKVFWGGQKPALDAWEILLEYLKTQPEEKVRKGDFATYLDALETMPKTWDCPASVSEDLSAFYVRCGMEERAVKVREAAAQAKKTMGVPANVKQATPAPVKQ